MKHVFRRLQISIYRKPLLYGFVGSAVLAVFVGAQAMLPTKALQSIDMLSGSWESMPASKKMPDGLKILPRQFMIVEQDGSGGQSNPPINLLGDRLEVQGDFTITATLSREQGVAYLWLYGQAPLIADEFRIDRASLRLGISDQHLEVTEFSSGQLEPVQHQQFSLPAPNDHLEITQRGQELVFKVGRTVVGTMNSGVFSSNQIWFGAEAQAEPWQLRSLQAAGLNGGKIARTDLSKLQVPQAPLHNASMLQKLATQKRPGFVIGAAMALAPLASDTSYRNLALGGNFGSMTPENALKWQFIHPEQTVYDFNQADALVNLAQRHGLMVHGHPLVFGEANPAWVTGLATHASEEKQFAGHVMREHIVAVMDHFKGRIASWDVINEPLMDYDQVDPQIGTGLRQHIWWQALGEDYIDQALQVAHRTDPEAALFINEYGLESEGERWDAFVALLQRLQSRDVPLTGVGFQSHIYEPGDRINPEVLQAHIRQLGSMGLQVRISELDVYGGDGEINQAQQYASVLQTCLAEPNCVAVSTWGISDRYNFWKDDSGIRQGQDFLWGEDMQPRRAVSDMQALLKE